MRAAIFSCLLVSTAVLGAAPAIAQYDGEGSAEAPIVLSNDPKADVPTVPQAPNLPSNVPVANHPAWTVTAASIPEQYRPDGQPVPCIVSRNVGGTADVIKFSGGGGKLTGVAIDAASLRLAPKSTVTATIELDQARKPVTAMGYVSSPTSVVINTMKYPDLYTVLAISRSMRLKLGDGDSAVQMAYALDGIGNALKDLDACYNRNNKIAAQPAQTAATQPVIADAALAISQSSNWAPPKMAAALPAGTQPSLQISNERFVPDMMPLPEDGVAVEPAPAEQRPLAERDIPPVVTPQAAQSPRPVMTVGPVVSPPPAPVAAVVPVVQGKITDTFRARKGESLRDVMRRWASRAGIELVWTLPSDISLEKDYSYIGTFEDSLGKLLADYPDSGIKTTYAQPAADISAKPYIAESQPPAVPPVAVQGEDLSDFVPTMPDLPAVRMPDQASLTPTMTAAATVVDAPVVNTKPAAFGPTKRWRALQGASMREVMQAWSDDAGIALIWRAPQDYVVRTSINLTADYGKAVYYLLDQYMAQPGRPTGQIYQDPATGAKSLVITPAQG